jgi:ABC-2 type transport system permease protein
VSALRGFVRKEFHHILRDRQTLLILLLLPLAQVLLFGFALRTDVRSIRLVVVDPSPDPATLALRNRFQAIELFDVVGVLPSAAPLGGWFERGAADQALVLEPRFAEALARGEGARALLITDASDPNTGSAMRAYAAAVVQDYEREARAARGGVTIVPRTRMRFNRRSRASTSSFPG